MMDSLDEFGKLDEFAQMNDMVSDMLAKASENKLETEQIAEIRQRRIQK